MHEKLEGRNDPRYGRGGAHIIHDGSNICFHFRHHRGDVEAGFRAADFVYEDTFYFPSAQHYPMEPHVCVAQFRANRSPCGRRRKVHFPFAKNWPASSVCRLAACA